MKNDYCVIGVGRFGQAVIDTLNEFNQKILAIDRNDDAIKKISSYVYAAYEIDATNYHALEESGIEDINKFIVGISAFQPSVLTCINLLDLLKNRKNKQIIAKATDLKHKRVLQSIGVDNVIVSERDSGRKVALKSIYNLALDITEIGNEHVIIKCKVYSSHVDGVRIMNLNWRNKYHANIIAIVRQNKVFIPQATDIIQVHDELIIIVRKTTSNKLYKYITVE